jgi:hypothetical protein
LVAFVYILLERPATKEKAFFKKAYAIDSLLFVPLICSYPQFIPAIARKCFTKIVSPHFSKRQTRRSSMLQR